MNRKLELSVDEKGVRLDGYLSKRLGDYSRAYLQRLIRDGLVMVNGKLAKAGQRLSQGDRVLITFPPPPQSALEPEEIPLSIVYEDDDLLVVDKPAGLPVHPAPGHPNHTLVNAILSHSIEIGAIKGTMRPGIVHRLDKDTSGLMLVAKNERAQVSLAQQIKDRLILKGYLILVKGHLSPERGSIEAPIGRDPRNRKRMAVVSRGRDALTHYQVISYPGNYTLLEVTPETGRTHQIRVHLSAIGHPVAGDSLYGGRSPILGRQFVHSHRLGFTLPSSGDYVEFESELPPDLKEALERISLL